MFSERLVINHGQFERISSLRREKVKACPALPGLSVAVKLVLCRKQPEEDVLSSRA